MKVCDFNRQQFDEFWRSFQKLASGDQGPAGLAAKLRLLHEQQEDQGFIAGAQSPEIFRLHSAGGTPGAFLVQFNPRRLLRHAGAGRTGSPPACLVRDPTDYLDRERIRWASGGTQLGLELPAGRTGRSLIAYAQPFPLAARHFTITAADGDETQDFVTASGTERIADSLLDLAEVAVALGPQWITIFNGPGGGGASLRRWHVQAIERTDGHGPYPLEEATATSVCSSCPPEAARWVPGYPIATLHFRGSKEAVVSAAAEYLRRWLLADGASNLRSANLIATVSTGTTDCATPDFLLWFVPRHGLYKRAPAFAGNLASLEMLGEVPLSTEDEARRLMTGEITYATVANALASVQPPGVVERLHVPA